MTTTIKDGDYFHYTFKEWTNHGHHCRDMKCVARAGRDGDIYLIDTFNYWPFKHGKAEKEIFTLEGLDREYSKYVKNDSKVELEFICNLNDYEYVESWEKDDYDGVVNVTYQCTKQWAKPKGAEVSKKALIAKYQEQMRTAEYEKSTAIARIKWIKEELARLSGEME